MCGWFQVMAVGYGCGASVFVGWGGERGDTRAGATSRRCCRGRARSIYAAELAARRLTQHCTAAALSKTKWHCAGDSNRHTAPPPPPPSHTRGWPKV
jgi:hypothetical protein